MDNSGTVSGGRIGKGVTILFCTFLKKKKKTGILFLTQFQSIFDGDIYFSGRFSSFFFCFVFLCA